MHVIFLLQCGCGTAQQGPQPQAVLFTPIDEDHGVYGPLVTLASPGLRLSSHSKPKNSEDGPPPRLLLASASVLLVSCLRAPSATGPKVVSPTIAPQSLSPISRRGGASTLCAPWASQSATLRAGRRDGDQRSTVRVHLQKSCSLAEEAKNFMFSLLARFQIIGFKLLAGNIALIRKFEKTMLPLVLLSLTLQRGVLWSFHSLGLPPPPINTGDATFTFTFTFHCPCFLASSLFLWRRFFCEGAF